MTDATRPTSFGESHEPGAEILIGRMIDGEASAEDDREFERLADAQPHLWRDLAQRQRDAAALIASVERRIAVAEAVEVPQRPLRIETARREAHMPRGPWLLATAGWAAALLLAVAWYFGAQPGQDADRPFVVTAEHISPEDQLRLYLQAPYVLGELDPVIEQLDPLPDGRVAMVALRRIQEVVFFDDPETIPVDEDWHLLKDPAELRAATH